MSEQPQGHGWWLAEDDLWYPPERHPDPNYLASLGAPTEDPNAAESSLIDPSRVEPTGIEPTGIEQVDSTTAWQVIPPIEEPQQAADLPPPSNWNRQNPLEQPQDGGQSQHLDHPNQWGQPRQWGQGYGPGQPGPRTHVQQGWVPPEAIVRPPQRGSWAKAVFGGLCLFWWMAVMAYGNGPMLAELIDLNGQSNIIVWRLMLVWLVVLAVTALAFWVFMHMASDRKRLNSHAGVMFGAVLVGLIPIIGFAGVDDHSPFLPHDRLGWAIIISLGFFVVALWRLSTRRHHHRSTRLPEAMSYIVPFVALLWGTLIFVVADFGPDWFSSNSSRSSGSGTTVVAPNDTATAPAASSDAGESVANDIFNSTTTVPERPTYENLLDFHGIAAISARSSTEEQIHYYQQLIDAFHSAKHDFCHGYEFFGFVSTNSIEISTDMAYGPAERFYTLFVDLFGWGLSHIEDPDERRSMEKLISIFDRFRDPDLLAVRTDDPRVEAMTDEQYSQALDELNRLESELRTSTDIIRGPISIDRTYILDC